ncbi:MAG TPA: hypothetical protein VHO43_01595 [Ignavibacteriales bacterium]|nr:hypothetical protein [Ignavibacteriales bacterium]
MEYVYNSIKSGIKKDKYTNYSVSLAAVYVIILSALVLDRRFDHWFLIPVGLAGILSGADAVKWFRQKDSIFDVEGIVGIIGFHFFFLAPMMHVYFDYWMKTIDRPQDWRDWLGGMAIVNSVGLMFYAYAKDRLQRRFSHSKSFWALNAGVFHPLAASLLIISFGLQVWVFIRQGGLLGYIMAFSKNEGAFEGMGWIFMISESFPILFLLYVVFLLKERKISSSWIIVILMCVFFALKMIFGGLRGSRSNTIWGLFWAIGIIDLWLKKVSKRAILIFALFILAFMYIYGFYKQGGIEAAGILREDKSRSRFEQTYNRSFEAVLLGDFARSDVQAYLLYRLSKNSTGYEYAYGRTYLGALSLIVPKGIWKDRPLTKVKEGEEIQGGIGASRIYGLAGEAMLNFGPFAAVFFFVIFGFAVGLIKRFADFLEYKDARVILIPFLINLAFLALGSDSDNIVFFLIKQGFLPFMLIYLSSRKYLFQLN